MKTAKFRFYEELNDFLPKENKKISFTYHFSGKPAIKDSIEAIGVPHTEVDLILVNGRSVTFDYQLKDEDLVSVYPASKKININKFILDTHLGKLAKYLRMLGFDTLYENNYKDKKIIAISIKEKRIILTRDLGILKTGKVTHGYWVRHVTIKAQLKEIINRFDLTDKIKPFTRCLICNNKLRKIAKEKIIHQLPANTKRYYNEFYKCHKCGQIYWPGSHYKNMLRSIRSFCK